MASSFDGIKWQRDVEYDVEKDCFYALIEGVKMISTDNGKTWSEYREKNGTDISDAERRVETGVDCGCARDSGGDSGGLETERDKPE